MEGVGAEQVPERPLGVFSRQQFLGDTLDHNRANYDVGVLTLRISDHRAGQFRRIELTDGPTARRGINA